jgi:hypothetical protein
VDVANCLFSEKQKFLHVNGEILVDQETEKLP